MANYPSVVQALGTTVTATSGKKIERSRSGRPTVRRYFSQDRYLFTLVHDCDDAAKALIEAHYDAHQMVSFNMLFVPTNDTYQVAYLEYPKSTPIEGEERWRIEVSLVETSRLPAGMVKVSSASSVVVTGENLQKSAAVVVTGVSGVSSAAQGQHQKVVVASSISTVTVTRFIKRHSEAVSVSVTASVTATGTNP